jgi:hypothetical protein
MKSKGLTDLVMKGGKFSSCTAKNKQGKRAQAALSKKALRRLRGKAKGKFRTRGRYGAATVRGTKWTVTDRCDGTLVNVTRGKVAVRDFRPQENGARQDRQELPRKSAALSATLPRLRG